MLDRDDIWEEYNRLLLKQTLDPQQRQRLDELQRMLAPRPKSAITQPVKKRFPKDHPILQIPTPKIQIQEGNWEDDPMFNLLSEGERNRIKQIIHTTHQFEETKDPKFLVQLNQLQLEEKEDSIVNEINMRKQSGQKMSQIMNDKKFYDDIIETLNKKYKK